MKKTHSDKLEEQRYLITESSELFFDHDDRATIQDALEAPSVDPDPRSLIVTRAILLISGLSPMKDSRVEWR
jgi:hypothetical protein